MNYCIFRIVMGYFVIRALPIFCRLSANTGFLHVALDPLRKASVLSCVIRPVLRAAEGLLFAAQGLCSSSSVGPSCHAIRYDS